MSTFGEWVRQQRQDRRLTRQELAQRVGCSVAMLRKIEGDERRPSEQIAELLANAFDIAPAHRPTFVRVARGELATNRLPRGTASTDPSDASRDSESPADNLPITPTPLIGRRVELHDLSRLIHIPDCRLLTLVGPGGIGKTRLAVELASLLRGDFADGVCFVPLASASTLRLLIPMMADAMGFAFQSAEADPRMQLFNHLRDKQMLAILDNVEQLLREPGIELLAELLGAAPGIKILTTSREPLNLHAEWVFEVGGLPVPADPHGEQKPEDTSVELFLQRARRARAGFSATSEDYPAIVRICQLAQGTPLAIELAAGWVRTLTCAEIAAELERSLDLLSASVRDLPARHRSMRAVFDHSWTLLTVQEQRALARLSVFRGGFGREAAEQVAGASLPMLSALGAKSLVRRSGEGRYELHELIRQYAAVYLQADPAEEADARQQHYAFYLDLAEASGVHLKTADQLQWLHRLEEEHDNLRAALQWSLNRRKEQPGDLGEAAMRLTGALRRFWLMGSYHREGCASLKLALGNGVGESNGAAIAAGHAMPATTDRPGYWLARARAVEALALLENSLGHHAVALGLAEESAGIYRRLDHKQGLGEALVIIGQALHWQGDVLVARTRIEEALELFRQTGDRWNMARALFHIGTYLADFAGDEAGGRKLEESEAILEELGDRFILLRLLVTRGIMAFTHGDHPQAGEHFTRALSLARELRYPWGIADALTNIGCVLRVQGSYDAARSHFEEAQRVYEQWGRGPWCADPLCALAENEIVQGNLSSAASYLHQAVTYVNAPENKWLHVLVTYLEGLLAYYRGDLQSAANLLEQTVDLARASHFKPDLSRALVVLARTLGAAGEVDRARLLNSEALNLFAEPGCKLGIAKAFETFAALAPAERAGRAARLIGTAEAIRSSIGAPLPSVDRPDYERTLAALRECLGECAFEEAREHGRTEAYVAVVDEILIAFRSGRHLAPAITRGTAPPRPTTALGSA